MENKENQQNKQNKVTETLIKELEGLSIRSVLFAKLIQRPNKVKPSDNLDITWASAYLPFVDYAVTDKAFCDLLKSSGLANQYNTKIYDIISLPLLLN